MGQYYRFIFLSESGEILHWINSYDFHCSKMMEFAWQSKDGLCEAVEGFIAGPLILANGNFRGESKPRYRIVCAGDYGSPEPKPQGSQWTQKKQDLETVLDAVKGTRRYSLLDGVSYQEVVDFLQKSPLDYTDTDRTFIQNCINAWHTYNMKKNLYHMCDDLPNLKIKPQTVSSKWYPYIVNHTRKEYVDKRKNSECKKRRGGDESSDEEDYEMMIHPLPLLVSETAGGGGGDYHGTNESDVGCWARDVITMESRHPGDEYKEFIVGFREC
jgi:hypothetical protein